MCWLTLLARLRLLCRWYWRLLPHWSGIGWSRCYRCMRYSGRHSWCRWSQLLLHLLLFVNSGYPERAALLHTGCNQCDADGIFQRRVNDRAEGNICCIINGETNALSNFVHLEEAHIVAATDVE